MKKFILFIFMFNFFYSQAVRSENSIWYVLDVFDNTKKLKCKKSFDSPFNKYIEVGGPESEIKKMVFEQGDNDFAFIIYHKAEAVSYFFSEHSRCDLLLSMTRESLLEERNAQKNNQQVWKVSSIKKQHSAPYGGDEPYTVICSNNLNHAFGIVQVTNIGKSFGNICVSGGPYSVNVCRGKNLWSVSDAAQKICGG